MRCVKLAMAAALIVASSSPAVATMAARMSRQQIVRSAARIMHGTVVEVRSGRDESGAPATWTTLDVAHGVKGTAPGRVTIKQIGVTEALPDGAFLQIAGLPRYRVGEELVLFLRGESSAGFTSPVGFGQGVFHVARSAGRARVVSPTASDKPELDEFLAEVGRMVAEDP